jgi:hypothetical protein
MANYLSGKDGALSADGVALAKVQSWSLQSTVDALEVTSLADIARDYTPGLMSSQGSCSVWMYGSNATALMGKVIRTTAPTEADKVTLRLGFGANAITVRAVITTCSLAMTVGEVMQAQLSFQVCGVPTAVALP